MSTNLWRTPGYPSWFTSDTASAIGAAMQGFGVSLVAYKISGSLIAAGWVPTLTGIVRQLANVLGGTVVDRHDRKHLVIANCITGVLLWGDHGDIAACRVADVLRVPCHYAYFVIVYGLFGWGD